MSAVVEPLSGKYSKMMRRRPLARKIPLRDFGSVRVRTPLVFAGQRVGIMGGTFNPPHSGHVLVAETAVKRLCLDQLWFVVTPGNPLKSHGDLPSLVERMQALRRITHSNRIKIAAFEAELGTPYTAATLAFLRRRYQGVNFVWVMGADNLASFERWQHWKQIATTFPIAVVDRPGWRFKALSSRAGTALASNRISEFHARELAIKRAPAWTFLTTRLSPLTSTMLRAARPRS